MPFYQRPLMVAILSFSVAVASSAVQAQARKGTVVSTAFVEEEIVADTTIIPGAVVAPPAVVISALRSAQVTLEGLQIGDFVRKGTKIATQDVQDLQTQLDLLNLQEADAKARLADIERNIEYDMMLADLAQSQLDLLTKKAERAVSLANKKAISSEAAETAQSAQLNATQQVILRKQSIDRQKASKSETERTIARLVIQKADLQRNMANANYNAPENGLILSLPTYQSGFARQGEELARIQGFRGFEVEAELPSSYLTFVRSADEIEADDGAGTKIALKFRAALPQENRRTSTRPVRFTVNGDLPRSLFASGARIDIAVPIREAQSSLLVPQDAIIPVAGGHVVFVFDEGKAVRQIVRLGGTIGENVIITSGVVAGERVIIKGNEGLSDGTDVREGTPPKRKAPTDGGEEAAAVQEDVLQTELADDAQVWLLEWTTPRGDNSAELTLSSKANLYDGEPIRVTRDGDKIAFDAEVVLPFGILTLSFSGTVTGDTMAGEITLSGLPNGRTPTFAFNGKVK